MLAAIDVIAQEQVVRLRRKTTIFEETQQVVVLPMNIATDLQRRFQLQEDGLREKNLARLEAEASNFALSKLYVLAWP